MAILEEPRQRRDATEKKKPSYRFGARAWGLWLEFCGFRLRREQGASARPLRDVRLFGSGSALSLLPVLHDRHRTLDECRGARSRREDRKEIRWHGGRPFPALYRDAGVFERPQKVRLTRSECGKRRRRHADTRRPGSAFSLSAAAFCGNFRRGTRDGIPRFRGSREPSDRRSVGPSKRGFREKLTPFLGNRGYALFVRQPFPTFSKGGCRDRYHRFHSRRRRVPRRDRLPLPAGPPQEPAPLEARTVPALKLRPLVGPREARNSMRSS